MIKLSPEKTKEIIMKCFKWHSNENMHTVPPCFVLPWWYCNGGYFSETSLRSRIPPARPRDPVIHIKPQAPKALGYCCRCLIRIQVRNKEQSLSPEPRLNGECWDTVTLAQSAGLERVNDMIMCFGVLHIYLLQSSILMHLLTTFDFRETDLEIDYVRRHIAWRLRFRFLSVY